MKITRVGVDLAKKVFQVHGVDAAGRQVWKRQLKRSSWLSVLTETVEPECEIGMEACGGAHHWARELKSRGFKVKLISPQFVKPYLKSLKNDVNDAEAICEAMARHHMRFVAVKTVEQQDIQAMRTVLFAKATAATFGCLRLASSVTQRLSRSSLCLALLTTDLAPWIRMLRK
jgi:transposase